MSSQSSLTGNILGTIGAVVGAIYGGPVGAAQGYAIGSSIGNVIDPPKGPTIQGPRLADKSVQVSTYGAMLPRFYGTIGVSGNITWLENNQLKETVRKKKSGGKGGGSSATTKIYTYSATFILSLGIGPIAGVRRIWCGDKLIYNAGSDDLETIIASNQAASGFRVYLGTDDQLPDPRYEADVGVGNASAFRGEAYIAFYDFQLADFANSLQAAQFKVEVVTSKSDAVTAASSPVGAVFSGTDMEYFKGAYYAVAAQPSNNLLKSYDGQRWTASTIPGGHSYYSIRSNGSVLVALASDGHLAISGDGLLWTDALLPVSATFEALIWTGSEFCAVGSNSAHSMTSPDGLVWTLGAMPASRNWRDVAWNGSRYCAVADSSQYGAISTDGLVWTHVDLGTSRLWRGIAWNGQKFLAIARVSLFFATSPDGVSWTPIASPSQSGWENIEVNADGFVMLGGAQVARSDDGQAWTSFAVPSENWSCLLLQGTAFYAICPGTISLHGFFRLIPGSPTLQDVVEAEVALSSLLTVADLDASALTHPVRGYRVSGGSIRSALEPLQGAFPFDIIQSGYQLKCVPRGQSSVLNVSWDDLVTDGSQDIGDILKESREMDSQLPARTNIKYLDSEREYAVSEQYSERPNTQSINRVDREFPIVITANEAAKAADVLNNLPWQERTTAQTSLPPTMLALEPSDVITLTTPFAVYEYRIADSKYNSNGSTDIQVRTNNAAIYTSSAEGSEGVPPSGLIPLRGPTLWLPLDIPVVDETIQDSPGFGSLAAGYTSGWDGAVVFRTLDSGQTWLEIQAYTGNPTIGTANGVLSENTGHVIQKSSLTISLISGELESITRDQMIAGQNFAAYGSDGRWEIIRFQDAVLQIDGTYIVSNFVRGDKGTEWSTGLHENGDYFVLLDDPDNVFIDMAVSSIGIDATYRGVTSEASIDTASDVPFTYQGVNLEPLSAVTPNGVRDVSGNFTGSFSRRSRLSSSWWTTGIPAPIGETTESYEIDVMSGSTVKRTISVSTPSFSYSAADQTIDFGSVQASITFRIYQLSGKVGRGYVLETTL